MTNSTRLVLWAAALAHLLHGVHEGDTISNERQKMRAVDPSPTGLRHTEELYSEPEINALWALGRACPQLTSSVDGPFMRR